MKNKRQKRNVIASLSRSDSGYSNEMDDFNSEKSFEVAQSRPILFNGTNQDVEDINASAVLESSNNGGFFNKGNDPLLSKNQMGFFAFEIGISYSFAKAATIENDCIRNICEENIAAASGLKRNDLVKIWKMVGISLAKDISESTVRQQVWQNHPTGWLLVRKLIGRLKIM